MLLLEVLRRRNVQHGHLGGVFFGGGINFKHRLEVSCVPSCIFGGGLDCIVFVVVFKLK